MNTDMKKQTAVEWLESELDFLYQYMTERNRSQLFEQAKAMEMEQIFHCYEQAYRDGYIDNGKAGQDYYNETYGGDK